MAHVLDSKSHKVQFHNSTHHFALNTFCNAMPELLKPVNYRKYIISITSGAVHFTGIFPPDVM